MPKSNIAAGAILTGYNKLPDFKATMKEAASLGATLTSGGVQARMMGLAFREGLLAHAKGMTAHDFEPAFDAFAANWYGKGNGGNREPLDKKSRKTLLAGYQHFTNAGCLGPKWQPLVVAVMEMVNTPIATRGSKIGALVEKGEVPDAAAIAKATGKKKSGKRTTAYNGEGRLKGLASAGEAFAAEDAKNKPFLNWLKDKPVYAPLVRDYLEAVAAIRLALINREKAGSVNVAKWKKLNASTLKVANGLPRTKSAQA